MLKKDFLLAILVAAIWGANYSVITGILTKNNLLKPQECL